MGIVNHNDSRICVWVFTWVYEKRKMKIMLDAVSKEFYQDRRKRAKDLCRGFVKAVKFPLTFTEVKGYLRLAQILISKDVAKQFKGLNKF